MNIQIDPEFKSLILPLAVEERAQLEANIVAEGCLDPLKVWNGILLDGHNRYEICAKHHLSFEVVDLNLPDRHAAHNWIINNQLGRRNITSEYASYLRGKRYMAEKRERGGTGANQHKEQIRQNDGTAERLAEQLKVSPRTVERDAAFAAAVDTIAENAGDEARQAILCRDTNLSKKDVERIAKLEPEKQKEVVSRAIQGEKGTQLLAQVSLQKRQEAVATLPANVYNVIYADPPWQYQNDWIPGAAENHYGTMTIEDIADLPEKIGLQVAENAVLFMWVTNPFVVKALSVIERWGFEYKSNLVWVKTDLKKPGVGFYVRGRHELLFICTRGTFTPLNPNVSPPIGSVLETPIREHSQKPVEIYDIIETLYPQCNYLELFSRTERSGWTMWGNQVGLYEAA